MDVLTTATLRPTILHRTMSSFYCCLLQQTPIRHILNIDPVGENSIKPTEVISVVEPYISDLLVRVAPTPNFAAAWKWVWSMAETDIVLHLEDDWELLRNVDLYDVMGIFSRNPNLANLRLPMFSSGETVAKQWNKHFFWNGEFFEARVEDRGVTGVSGHPTFIRVSFINSRSQLLNL